jgi:hypothetical protein
MASSTNGLIGPADLVITMDAMAGWLKYAVSVHGQGLSSESSIPSLAYQALLAQSKILGDGVTNYGIANSLLQTQLAQKLTQLYLNSRFETFAGTNLRQMIGELNSELSASSTIPKYLSNSILTQWNMSSSSTQTLDAHLQRVNATNVGVPATPAGTPTLTATTAGSLPNTLVGNAPVMCYTFVGASDWLESQPSPVSTQVALSGANNAYSITGISTVPTGVTKIRLYRSAFGTTTPLLYDRDVPVSAGAAPALKFTFPDIALYPSVLPPVWAQSMMLSEAALAFALCNISPTGNPLGAYTVSSNGLLSPSNVVLNSVNGILGYNNPTSSGTFATWSATANTFGSIQITNSTSQGSQGFLGAFGVQARTTSALASNATITSIGYSYVTAASPLTPLTSTISGPLTLNAAAGSTVSLAIPTGQCVQAITSMTVSGPATGVFVLEAIPLRAI